tara:strand:+ start:474 stop:878 length:405 start_codon:yes stop_codon:yes gene_type:complete
MTRKVLKACRLQKYGLSIILSNDKQVQYLNYKWKGRNKPTNVLSFPSNKITPHSNFQKHYLGDIILGYQTLKKEATFGKLLFINHMSHLLIHGILHLKGYSHNNRINEKVMQIEEIRILKILNIFNPYKNHRLI